MTAAARAFPTADQVATAIVAAARLTGEDPVGCIAGAPAMRCRAIAFEALRLVFPEARVPGLGRCVGWRPTSTTTCIANAKIRSWWSDDAVDEVVGALIGEPEPQEDRDGEAGAAGPERGSGTR